MRATAPAAARAGLLFAVVLAADQATKAIVRSTIERGDEDPVLPFLKLVHTKNTGVAFGAFAGGGAVVAVLVGVALTALLVFFWRQGGRAHAWVPVGLLLGGAIGNVVDRARIGGVTDFLKLPAWPAFNLADVAITFGVLALLYVLEREDGDGAPRPA